MSLHLFPFDGTASDYTMNGLSALSVDRIYDSLNRLESITGTPAVGGAHSKDIDLTWIDRADANGDGGFIGWVEDRFGNLGDHANWFFNLNVKWNISDKYLIR